MYNVLRAARSEYRRHEFSTGNTAYSEHSNYQRMPDSMIPSEKDSRRHLSKTLRRVQADVAGSVNNTTTTYYYHTRAARRKHCKRKHQQTSVETPLLQHTDASGQNLSRSGGQCLNLPGQPLRQGLRRRTKIEQGGQSNRCNKNRAYRKNVNRLDIKGRQATAAEAYL